MDFHLTPTDEAFRDEVRSWLKANLPAGWPDHAPYTTEEERSSFLVAAEGIQLHGGIGFTWDHDLHLYYKRAESSRFTFGGWHRDRVARTLEAP